MTLYTKNEEAYKTIGEVAKELNLINKNTGKLQTHTIRYWETQFKQIKPTIGPGKRRYYSKKNFIIIKSIKYLLKEKGLTINGVKKILNNQSNSPLDPNIDLGVYNSKINNTNKIKKRINNITKIIRELKNLK
jgi:DNA-binding transcriptional MerR regulator|tara:strand:- start:205 stop:603 length:399 start_codon:yes stop_codon:yes gene_type:complete